MKYIEIHTFKILKLFWSMCDIKHHTPGRLPLEHLSFGIRLDSWVFTNFRSQGSLDVEIIFYSLTQFSMTSKIKKTFVIHAEPIDWLVRLDFEWISSLSGTCLQRFWALDVIVINNSKLRKHVHLCTLFRSCVQLQSFLFHFFVCLSSKVFEWSGSFSAGWNFAFFLFVVEMVRLKSW